MKRNDNFEESEADALWDLLGHARTVEISPFFSRNVLRELRKAQERPHPVLGVFRRWRLLVFGAAAVAIVLASSCVLLQDRSGMGSIAQNSVDTQVVRDLDELLASDDSKVWLDRSVY